MRDSMYRLFLRTQAPCAVPLCNPRVDMFQSIIDPAHTVNNGGSSKGPDSSCAPLCRRHHQEYDSGRLDFEATYGLDMKATAARWYAIYLEQRT